MKKAVIFIILILGCIAGYYVYAHSTNLSKKAAQTPASVTQKAPIVQHARPLAFSDIQTMTVPSFAEEGTPPVALKDGHYEDDAQSIQMDLDDKPASYAAGDLNGDGSDDLVAVYAETTGGTGYFYYLAAFLNEKGSPKLAAWTDLGDRITVNKISISKGVITADIVTQGPNDAMCCATLRKIFTYKLSGSALIETGSSIPK
ncbi:MAG: hypothetical protein JWO00_414 [Candidatus Parcubacteria bacterium]|nr:hypothetical protein [Candidatus Parcubacteria bacterium]